MTPLRLNAATLADIFTGRIARWDAQALRSLNPDVALPALPIRVVHRAVGSGTGRAFSEFLATSGRWRTAPGDSAEVPWPIGVAAEGNEGVASEVKVSIGAIGFVELTYARQNKLPVAAVQSHSGAFVQPVSAASRYPIMARTWLVVEPRRVPQQKADPLFMFIRWALNEGATQARAMEYTPSSPDTVARYDSLLRVLATRHCGEQGAAP